jgi:membrane-associated progesterone receptor component
MKMQNIEMLRLQLNNLVTQARYDIYTLSSTNDLSMQNQILQRLWDSLSSIHFLSELLANQAMNCNQQTLQPYTNQQQIPSAAASSNPMNPQSIQRMFTLEELSKYDGKNGMPAYVAVNGIVYDVTNNKAWAAATHFGLLAGKDLTKEFSSCHAGQQSILAALPVVGRLTQ